jgi:hypothetical protein
MATSDTLALSQAAAELASAVATMKSIAALADTASETAIGSNAMASTATLTSSSSQVVANRLQVTGTVALPNTLGISASSPSAYFRPTITFTATFDEEASGLLSAKAAVSLSAHLAILSSGSTAARNPIFETILLKGVLDDQRNLSGVVQLSVRFNPVTIN